MIYFTPLSIFNCAFSICLTDIARYKNEDASDDLIRNWLRNRNTIEFVGIWEQINNPGFNPVEFDGFRKQAGLNIYTLTADDRTPKLPERRKGT